MNIKKIINKTCALMLTFTLFAALASPISAKASETELSGKEEVIYISLNSDGSVKTINVVNIIGSGYFTDYGDYSSIRNMTTNDKLSLINDEVSGTSTADRLYYEGVLNNNLIPWNISINYNLDGTDYTAEQAAGKSGDLKLTINISENEEFTSCFYDDYALLITISLDTALFKNIIADQATMANAGSKKQLTYTILPGSGADISIYSDVSSFEMDEISINAVKLNLDFDISNTEISEKLSEITDSVNELNDGVVSLRDGVKTLNEKVDTELISGISELSDGINELNTGAGDLDNGVTELQSGAVSLSGGINDLSEGIDALSSGIIQLENALASLNAASGSLTLGSTQFKDALSQLNSTLNTVSISTDDLTLLLNASSSISDGMTELLSGIAKINASLGYQQYKDLMSSNGLNIDDIYDANLQSITSLTSQINELTMQYESIKEISGLETQREQLINQISQLTSLVTLLKGNNAAIDGMQAYLNSMSAAGTDLYDSFEELCIGYNKFNSSLNSFVDELIAFSDKLNSLKSAVYDLSDKYNEINISIAKYCSGVNTAASECKKLASGAAELKSGFAILSDGSAALTSGLDSLRTGTLEFIAATDALSLGGIELRNGIKELGDGIDDLYTGTKDMSDATGEFKTKLSEITDESSDSFNKIISELTASDSEIVSFTSNKNENVQSVQFVIKTEAISSKSNDGKTETVKEELNFWQKLLNLFGL